MSQRLQGPVLVVIMLLVAVVAGAMAVRSRLWVDEIFSLAMATGHSLEHPAAGADPAQGDFQLDPGVRSRGDWLRYLEHESPAASPARVIRATRLSDTSPPLYYVALSFWTRGLGTSDLSVRAFGIVVFLATFPLLAALARRLGGRPAVVPVCLFFGASPLALYYASEARMYPLLWFFTVAAALAAVSARQQRRRLVPGLIFVTASVGGFLTHYFFAFPWGAVVAAVFLWPGRIRRVEFFPAVVVVGVLLLPWYVQVPALLRGWRVTGDWLNWEPDNFSRVHAAVATVAQFASGNVRQLWRAYPLAGWLSAAVIVAAVVRLTRSGRGAAGPARRWLLPAAWFAAGCAGPFIFDAWRGSYTAAVPRYACGALPAASLLLGLLASRLDARWRLAVVACLLGTWTPGIYSILKLRDRSGFNLGFVMHELRKRPPAAGDLILVHSIPSGALAAARYLPGPAPMTAWVGQLGVRKVPNDLLPLVAGRRDIFLVRIHAVGEPAPEEEWLRTHYDVVDDTSWPHLAVVRFRARAAGP
ncbi:MAG TPA: glycosyltransferase family 39 protein [Lacunisphaera sp.]|nr:glycosyltransferase family 39 protein [Lacunisphaera sp.]